MFPSSPSKKTRLKSFFFSLAILSILLKQSFVKSMFSSWSVCCFFSKLVHIPNSYTSTYIDNVVLFRYSRLCTVLKIDYEMFTMCHRIFISLHNLIQSQCCILYSYIILDYKAKSLVSQCLDSKHTVFSTQVIYFAKGI